MIMSLSDEQKRLMMRLSIIEKETEKINDFDNRLESLKERVNEFLDFKELAKEMVYMLVSRIVIEHPKKDDNRKTQEVNIYYQFMEISL